MQNFMKKEYITYWSQEQVSAASEKMPWPRQRFFNDSVHKPEEIIIPDDITYLDLLGFLGKKTKVTIEVIE